MWINVDDKLPKSCETVFVKIGDDFGVASYSESYGFASDSSAYDVYCDDDSGLQIDLIAQPTHWMPIP